MKRICYIKGSKDNPKGVYEALQREYPDVKNPEGYGFTLENALYYVVNNMVMCIIEEDDVFSISRLLYEYGYELKPIREDRWRADIDIPYYYVDSDLSISNERELGYVRDDKMYEIGNYFATYAGAHEYAEKIRKIFEERI